MFKKRETVVYPIHGVGKIVDKFEADQDDKREYLKIEFFDDPLVVSIPSDNAESLGLRYPISKNKMSSILKKLGKTVRVSKNIATAADSLSEEKLGSGKFSDAIEVVNMLLALKKKKEEEDRILGYTLRGHLESAMKFVKSEVKVVLGEDRVKKYDLRVS
ncbi:hypothetical protein JW710_02890 [Candidatus Dojkabacteria bacterium]|nr:hypothetical protein [Candidatus Dojkabacteria bacterium]